MDSEAIKREDRLARYVLTGLVVTVCTWALTLMGVADAVIPYVLPPAILILCGRYILVGSTSDVEPQAKALASVVGGIALGLVAASGSGYFFVPVPAAGYSRCCWILRRVWCRDLLPGRGVLDVRYRAFCTPASAR